MPPPAPSSAERKLALAYETSYRKYAPNLCSGTGGRVIKEDDICVHARPTASFGNGLYYSPWKAHDVPEKLRRAIRLYQQTGQGMGIITGPSSPADAMRGELRTLGFKCAYHLPFMRLDLNNIRYPAKPPNGTRVCRVTDFSVFRKHEHPWHGKATSNPRRAIFSFFEKETNAPRQRLWQFIAFEGEVPVASAMIFRTGRICGVYDVATVRSHRRRGIGHSIMAAACEFARDQGMTVAALGASGKGVGLYEKTGFKLCGSYGEYYLGKARLAAVKV